jgi:hypothetical protein
VTSIFQRHLGADFGRLHPALRERFGFSADDAIACVGTGVMESIWRGPAFTLPFLHLGATRHILFPERGDDIPFTIENYAYRDGFGRETVTFVRTFHLPRRQRRFDATMIYSPTRGGVIDYLGTHQHLAVDLDLRVDPRGGLWIRTGGLRLHEGPLGLRVPALLRGDATVHEWYDEAIDRFHIDVEVRHRTVGPLFGYRGTFTTEYRETTAVPATVRPLRESGRE